MNLQSSQGHTTGEWITPQIAFARKTAEGYTSAANLLGAFYLGIVPYRKSEFHFPFHHNIFLHCWHPNMCESSPEILHHTSQSIQSIQTTQTKRHQQDTQGCHTHAIQHRTLQSEQYCEKDIFHISTLIWEKIALNLFNGQQQQKIRHW